MAFPQCVCSTTGRSCLATPSKTPTAQSSGGGDTQKHKCLKEGIPALDNFPDTGSLQAASHLVASAQPLRPGTGNHSNKPHILHDTLRLSRPATLCMTGFSGGPLHAIAQHARLMPFLIFISDFRGNRSALKAGTDLAGGDGGRGWDNQYILLRGKLNVQKKFKIKCIKRFKNKTKRTTSLYQTLEKNIWPQ